jgi:hypothetical protein
VATGAAAASQPRGNSLFTLTMRSETKISAPPEVVWSVLSEFASFPEWNPFITSIEGKMVVGTRLKVAIAAPPGSKPTRFTPLVVVVNPNREFTWRGSLAVPGMLVGNHFFKLEPAADGGTVFIHGETFVGLLVPYFRANYLDKTELGFSAMDQAIKVRAEAIARPSN